MNTGRDFFLVLCSLVRLLQKTAKGWAFIYKEGLRIGDPILSGKDVNRIDTWEEEQRGHQEQKETMKKIQSWQLSPRSIEKRWELRCRIQDCSSCIKIQELCILIEKLKIGQG